MLAYVTHPDLDEALKLARELVAGKLAAGINIVPGAISIYRWEGAVKEKNECLMLCQVSEKIYPEFQKAVLARHPYRTPCVIAMHLAAGDKDFLEWIDSSCGAS